ncbi:hypothetical protein OPAG_06566 [Rhodococcus opacus PD630]|uniref:hypothetical protein n=1 Tax=Rhodococcus opacus TaxID=37919 RepID=UPI00029CAFC3|nr:hypothetical protein [Rhodococcus opacus]AHK35677.1 hypothetical protein Pd630_LPD12006 [Rhodococcus opacus PD630]EHI43291.1 hypothetical protein OPAG_06566 [Rhodococcus opacus PD630]
MILWQHYFDVPQPRVYPHGSFTSFGPDPPPASYWVSWAGPAVVVACGVMTVPWRPARRFALPLVCAFLPMAALVACGVMTVPWRPARRFALPLVCAFLPMAALVAWFMIGMELLAERTELRVPRV